jgi:transposase-like protein
LVDTLDVRENTMMAKRKRRTFSAEFRLEAIKLAKESGKTVGVLAAELGLSESCLRKWVTQAGVDAGQGQSGALTTAEREEITQLRREVKTLRMEREILKKATAFFAKENA